MNAKKAKHIRRVLATVHTVDHETGEKIPLDNTDKWEHTNISPVNLPFWIPVYYNSTARRARATMRGAYRALKRNVLIAMRDRRSLLTSARNARISGSFLARASRTQHYDRAKEQVHNNWDQDKKQRQLLAREVTAATHATAAALLQSMNERSEA
jgi:hypothetical protein